MGLERSRPKAPPLTKAVLWLVLLFLYLPLGLLLVKTLLEPLGILEVLRDQALLEALTNSLIVALSAAVLSTLIGTMAALALKQNSAWNKVLNSLSLVSLIFPEIVFALSLLSWFFVLGLDLGLPTVIIAHVSFSLSYVMMIVGARLATFDASLTDAARDLGASEGHLLKTVILPLLKPAIISGFILSFLLSFDDFLITYFVNGVGHDTLPVKLYAAMKTGLSSKITALASMMLVLTCVLLVILFRASRKLIRPSV